MKMRKTGTILVSLAMILCLCTSIVQAVPTQPGKGQIFPPPKLDGTRINVEGPRVALATDAPTFVIHGWDYENWKTVSKEDQKDFLETYTFELYIDGEQIELKSWKHYYADQDLMKVGFYVEFKGGHFEPGTYTFKGVWRPDNAKAVVKITFYAP